MRQSSFEANNLYPRQVSIPTLEEARTRVRFFEGKMTEIIKLGNIEIEYPSPEERLEWKRSVEIIDLENERSSKVNAYTLSYNEKRRIYPSPIGPVDRIWYITSLAILGLIPAFWLMRTQRQTF